MKIWIVNHYAIPPRYGGLNRHYYFTKYFNSQGHDVKILTSSKIHNTTLNFKQKNQLYFDEVVDDVTYTYIKSSDYSGNGLSRIFSFLEFPARAKKTLKKLIKDQGKPDILYASSPELFSTAVTVAFGKKHKIPVVVEIRDLWPESIVEYTRFTKKNPVISFLYGLEKWVYKKADRLVFTIEGGRDYIISRKLDISQGGKIDLNKVSHVNNGVDIRLFQKNGQTYIAEDPELDSKKFKVVYTGSVRKVNSIGLLVQVAKELEKRKISDVSIVIYGDGTEKEKLKEQSKQYGLENIFFRDRVDKKYIPSILSRSNLNIFVGEGSSLYNYGLSLNKLFDYMAAGKPILSNIPSGYDNILRYGCGKVVKGNSADAIVDGILYFKDMEKEKYDQYCNNAKKAAKEFDYNHLAEKMEIEFKKTDLKKIRTV